MLIYSYVVTKTTQFLLIHHSPDERHSWSTALGKQKAEAAIVYCIIL